MFFGFKLNELRRLRKEKKVCTQCDGEIFLGSFVVVHSFFQKQYIKDLFDEYMESMIDCFEEAIKSMIGERDADFFLTINDHRFHPMCLCELGSHLRENMKDEDERLDLSEPEILIRVHIIN